MKPSPAPVGWSRRLLQAGRGTFKEGASGWMMAQVSQPRGSSFEDAKLRFEDVKRALKEKSGTVSAAATPRASELPEPTPVTAGRRRGRGADDVGRPAVEINPSRAGARPVGVVVAAAVIVGRDAARSVPTPWPCSSRAWCAPCPRSARPPRWRCQPIIAKPVSDAAERGARLHSGPLVAGRAAIMRGLVVTRVCVFRRPLPPTPTPLDAHTPPPPVVNTHAQVVVNSAGAYIRPLGGVCLDVVQALDMPVCLNMYITAAGQRTSAPPHTDKQDVFVMQTQVRAFTPRGRMTGAGIYTREKPGGMGRIPNAPATLGEDRGSGEWPGRGCCRRVCLLRPGTPSPCRTPPLGRRKLLAARVSRAGWKMRGLSDISLALFFLGGGWTPVDATLPLRHAERDATSSTPSMHP